MDSGRSVIIEGGTHRLLDPSKDTVAPTLFTADQAKHWMNQRFMATNKLGEFVAVPTGSEVPA